MMQMSSDVLSFMLISCLALWSMGRVVEVWLNVRDRLFKKRSKAE